MTALIIISALMLAVGLTACVKSGRTDNIVNYEYIEK